MLSVKIYLEAMTVNAHLNIMETLSKSVASAMDLIVVVSHPSARLVATVY
jgi:hypothetical protein